MLADNKLIQRKITLINRDLKNLEKIDRIPLAKYLKNDAYEALAERYLERIIGRLLDINYHILTETENYSPLDYYDSFIAMGKRRYLPVDLSMSLASAAGLRNRLAHEYDEIDERKIYRSVSRCLKEVPQYLRFIIKFLNKISKQRELL
ncbi:DUF86 domain-containing protein [Candidatus Falkowbacteria bacterium]|nr:DUF86 domain-containing protein [Candidatus Falkowbacteria bacterium]